MQNINPLLKKAKEELKKGSGSLPTVAGQKTPDVGNPPAVNYGHESASIEANNFENSEEADWWRTTKATTQCANPEGH